MKAQQLEYGNSFTSQVDVFAPIHDAYKDKLNNSKPWYHYFIYTLRF